jgi:hypothetical protein
MRLPQRHHLLRRRDTASVDSRPHKHRARKDARRHAARTCGNGRPAIPKALQRTLAVALRTCHPLHAGRGPRPSRSGGSNDWPRCTVTRPAGIRAPRRKVLWPGRTAGPGPLTGSRPPNGRQRQPLFQDPARQRRPRRAAPGGAVRDCSPNRQLPARRPPSVSAEYPWPRAAHPSPRPFCTCSLISSLLILVRLRRRLCSPWTRPLSWAERPERRQGGRSDGSANGQRRWMRRAFIGRSRWASRAPGGATASSPA